MLEWLLALLALLLVSGGMYGFRSWWQARLAAFGGRAPKWVLFMRRKSVVVALYVVSFLGCMLLVERLDTRQIAEGDTPHSAFRVAVFQPQGAWQLLPLDEVQAALATDKTLTLLPPAAQGEHRSAGESYAVLDRHAPEGVIVATQWGDDDDFSVYSRYALDASGQIKPLLSRARSPGIMFVAGPLALLWVFFLYGLNFAFEFGWRFRHRIRSDNRR